MKRLAIGVGGLALLVTAGLPGWATPAPTGPMCTVLTDARGDESFYGPTGSAATDPALDLLAATLRSDGRTLHASVRVSDLGTTAAGSRSWVLNFGVEGDGYELQALQAVDGVRFAAYGPGADTYKPSLGYIQGRLDVTSNVILMDVPLSQLRVNPQARFLDFSAVAGHGMGTADKGPIGAQDATFESDSGLGHKSYRLDRGCP